MISSSRFAVWVAIPPIVTALLWTGALVVNAVTGTHPIWRVQPRNVAEAAAARDGAAVLRFVGAGANVNGPGDVAGGLVLPDTRRMTALEAAAIRGEREMIQLLLDIGPPDANAWHAAFCASDSTELRALLTPHRPAGAADRCDGQ
jgi:hypothetical protein